MMNRMVGCCRLVSKHGNTALSRQRRLVLPRVAHYFSSDSITYSGGHASDGQGGFYASGASAGVRASSVEPPPDPNGRQSMLAHAADVEKLSAIMVELENLEGMLQDEPDATSARSIELKANLKKLVSHPELAEILDRLQASGEPVWGLSSAERELIIYAKEKVNEC